VILSSNKSSGCSALFLDETELTMLNCIIAGNGDIDGEEAHPICHSSPFTDRDATFINCIVSDGNIIFPSQPLNWVNLSHCDVTGGYPGEGNIDMDPLFVDSENGNYRLQRGSPCIDSGTDTGVTMDLDGNPRPIGRYDMGAYEFPYLRSDIDGNGIVDEMDLMILSQDWKKVSAP